MDSLNFIDLCMNQKSLNKYFLNFIIKN